MPIWTSGYPLPTLGLVQHSGYRCISPLGTKAIFTLLADSDDTDVYVTTVGVLQSIRDLLPQYMDLVCILISERDPKENRKVILSMLSMDDDNDDEGEEISLSNRMVKVKLRELGAKTAPARSALMRLTYPQAHCSVTARLTRRVKVLEADGEHVDRCRRSGVYLTCPQAAGRFVPVFVDAQAQWPDLGRRFQFTFEFGLLKQLHTENVFCVMMRERNIFLARKDVLEALTTTGPYVLWVEGVDAVSVLHDDIMEIGSVTPVDEHMVAVEFYQAPYAILQLPNGPRKRIPNVPRDRMFPVSAAHVRVDKESLPDELRVEEGTAVQMLVPQVSNKWQTWYIARVHKHTVVLTSIPPATVDLASLEVLSGAAAPLRDLYTCHEDTFDTMRKLFREHDVFFQHNERFVGHARVDLAEVRARKFAVVCIGMPMFDRHVFSIACVFVNGRPKWVEVYNTSCDRHEQRVVDTLTALEVPLDTPTFDLFHAKPRPLATYRNDDKTPGLLLPASDAECYNLQEFESGGYCQTWQYFFPYRRFVQQMPLRELQTWLRESMRRPSTLQVAIGDFIAFINKRAARPDPLTPLFAKAYDLRLTPAEAPWLSDAKALADLRDLIHAHAPHGLDSRSVLNLPKDLPALPAQAIALFRNRGERQRKRLRWK